jgi:cell division septation protein DedD
MSDAQTPSDTKSEDTTKKTRSPVERAIVWGGIGILLIVAGIQGMAAYGFSVSQDKIDAAVKRANNTSDELRLKEAEELMSGIWSKTAIQKKGSDRFVVYSWTGVYQSYIILLKIGVDESNPLVVAYELNSETPSHSEMIVAKQNESDSGATDENSDSMDDSESSAPDDAAYGMGPGGPGGGPGQQGGGGRPSINWDELDKDGDDKVSKEEAPEWMQRFFDRIDTNEDGFIDKAEQEASAARRNSGGGRGGRGPGGGGGRPQRPTNDDDPPDTTSPEEPKSNPDEPDAPKKPEDE